MNEDVSYFILPYLNGLELQLIISRRLQGQKAAATSCFGSNLEK